MKSLRAFGMVVLLALGAVSRAPAQRHYHQTIWGADYVDLSHFGLHTHENNMGFGLWRLYMPGARNIRVRPHASIGTWSYPYGTIENWRTEINQNRVIVWIPTQIADYAHISYGIGGWRYWQTSTYWLDVDWDGP